MPGAKNFLDLPDDIVKQCILPNLTDTGTMNVAQSCTQAKIHCEVILAERKAEADRAAWQQGYSSHEMMQKWQAAKKKKMEEMYSRESARLGRVFEVAEDLDEALRVAKAQLTARDDWYAQHMRLFEVLSQAIQTRYDMIDTAIEAIREQELKQATFRERMDETLEAAADAAEEMAKEAAEETQEEVDDE